ncbi:hypothetical protein ES703_86440 [subsurface metagenome]
MVNPYPVIGTHVPLNLLDELLCTGDATEVEVSLTPHVSLYGEDSAIRVGNSLLPGKLAHQPPAVFEVGDHGCGQVATLSARYHYRPTAIKVGC